MRHATDVTESARGTGNAFRPSIDATALQLLAVTPFGRADIPLARAVLRHGGAVALDLCRTSGRDPGHPGSVREEILRAARTLAATDHGGRFGLRLPAEGDVAPSDLPPQTGFVIVAPGEVLARCATRLPVLAEVCSVAEAEAALAAGAAGLLARGQESGGAGDESCFILLQRVLRLAEGIDAARRPPVWAWGGMGLHAAAAAIAGGASGVVLDSQLALLADSTLTPELRAALSIMDGSEPRDAFAGHGIDPRDIGQDAALARLVAHRHPTVESLLYGYRAGIAGHLHQARELRALAADAPLARVHGTRYPIAQGPMTRVSDTAEFAQAVAENGALPFLALSLMDEASCRRLVTETRARLAGKPWGIGVLGFAPPEILEPQLALAREARPAAVLIAGGRPAQARPFIEMGIPAWLHVPSPGLLDLFLKDGARHFVFEGRECGGHVGPRFGFVLWEQQLETLLACDRPEELHVLFAGGIHDERSAAMIAALAAPLAARGAKIGVLMGSAYIATHEAVTSGAVIAPFREHALGGTRTTLVETAPGHAIRCLPTPFVDFFNAEKARLQAADTDPQSAWQRLEALNIGRLRIASKGVTRDGDALVPVDVDAQWRDGLYMIGQLAAMQDRPQSIGALHARVSDGATEFLARRPVPALPRDPRAEPVAIVGMSCTYAGSPDLAQYWANILAGRDLVTEVKPERWNAETYFDHGVPAAGKSVSRWGGFIDPVPFDPLQYGIPPQSLAAIEPVQLIALELARAALADAGYDAAGGTPGSLGTALDVPGDTGDAGMHARKTGRQFDRDRTAVIFGAESGSDLANAYVFRNLYAQYLGDMPAALDGALPALTEDSFPGVLVNVISGRIANRLGLGGANYAVDAACASSLTAIELAVKELRSGSSDLVLAGGADLHNGINDFMLFSSVGALSPRGRCRSFDAAADGICLGEGVGVVVLKRLADAERDGDRIYAVIDAVAGASDGRGLGLTAPRREGQQRALERACAQAGVLPARIGLVEAHGTGTVVGDRTELRTLDAVYTAGGALPARTALGSVKSQIGHAKCAAGIAGLIKVALALHHRVLPPTALVERPNDGYREGRSPFALNRVPLPWLPAERHAAVSAFGFGGTNFHAVLSAHRDAPCDSGIAAWPVEPFLLRGADAATARATARRYAAFLRDSDAPVALRDLAFSLAATDDTPVQFAFTAGSPAELRERLEAVAAGNDAAAVGIHARRAGANDKIAFLFPGQGSQYPGMFADLFVAFPWLGEQLADAPADLLHALFPPTAYTEDARRAQQDALTDTRRAQPALGLVEYAAATLLARLGVRPDMAAGHSYGELAALAVAGVMDSAQLLRLGTQRAAAILAAIARSADGDPGSMAAVALGARELAGLLGEATNAGATGVGAADAGNAARVTLANQNGPRQTVISGRSADVDAALALLRARGIGAKPLATACAFHSPVVAAAAETFAGCLAAESFAAPRFPVYANITAQPHAGDAAALRDLLARHLESPVRFVETVERMHADGARAFVEVGPKRVLGGCVAQILAGREHEVIALDAGATENLGGLAAFLSAVVALAVRVPTLHTGILFAGRGASRIDPDMPRRLSRTTWLADGARAWPLHGEPPAHAGRIVTSPVARVSPGTGPAVSSGTTADDAVLRFLDNMRDIAQAQRDVLLGLLGAPATAAPRPDVTPATDAVPPDILAAAGMSRSVVPADAPNACHADAGSALLALVGERTGYPVDMLDPDLDLEADLSIDSIKRMEIVGELAARLAFRARLGERADVLQEQLSTRKTLRAMQDLLATHLPADAPGVEAPRDDDAPVATSAGTAPATDPLQVLLAIVSARTGYPADVLDPDLDLEADLSIDSIKRMEIVGELVQQLALDAPPAATEAQRADRDRMLESLAGMKTLRAMGDWLRARGDEPATTGDATGKHRDDGFAAEATPIHPAAQALLPPPTRPDAANDDTPGLARYVLRSVDAPRAIPGAAGFHGKRFLITDDSLGVAERLAARLEARGAVVQVISFSESEPVPPHLENVDGLLHLWSLNPANRVRDVKRFFTLVRDLSTYRARYLLVASGLGGNFGCYRDSGGVLSADFGKGAGLAGMIKSLAKEFPDVRAHWVDLDLAEPADDLAACLELELRAENDLTEVAYRTGQRRQLQAVRSELSLIADIDNLDLDADSVVLLTGGARGITARIAIALARRFRCRLELVGRSAPPADAAEPAAYRAARDRKALRQAVIAAHPGMRPADVEKTCARVLAERDMRDTFAGIRRHGGTVNYTQLDVRDIDAFSALINGLYEKHGRIDGVVHGAGIVEDKLVRHKTSESFQRVFDTKVRGALMLYKLLRDDVKFVVFFSSVAGAFGNRGQVDYASANDVLDKIAHAMQARVHGRVLSVNWGPWADTGMVSAELEREYARRGIGLIPLDAGVEALLRELSFGRREDTQVVLMCGTPASFGAAPDAGLGTGSA